MLVDGPVLDLVHLIELALEEDEVPGSGGAPVEHALLELLEGVHDFEEVSLAEEELEVLLCGFLYADITKEFYE